MFFSVQENLNYFKKQFNDNFDIVSRELTLNTTKIGILFNKSMIDKEVFVTAVLSPLMDYNKQEKITSKKLSNDILKMFEINIASTDEDAITKLTENNVLIFVEGEKISLCLDLEKAPVRMPTEPPTSPVIRGPREGFVEDIKTNIGLIRLRLKTEHLAIKNFEVGRYTKTKVCVFALKGVADDKIVEKVCKKIQNIDIDGIIDSHYILSFLQEGGGLLFKQVGTSEKPDVIAAKMLEGRVAIVVDGSPIVLTVPFIILEDLQSANDYYTNPLYVALVRIIRGIGIILTIILPGVFLSFRLYHYKALPLKYLITISNSTQGLPFSPFIEMVFILLLFQILYEVSLRLPRYLGIATSIVGALILGDTGVKAGLISPPVVIIVAMSMISIYTIPDQAPQLTVLRWIFIGLGGTLGLLGIVGGMIFFINEMNSLNLFGSAYLAPFSPRVKPDLEDSVFKRSITEMRYRPQSFKNKNKVRLKK